MEWQEIGKWVAAIIAVVVGAGLAFRFVFVRKSSISERSTTQSGNHAGRDIIGGDKIDKR
jgi:hypothetical protein